MGQKILTIEGAAEEERKRKKLDERLSKQEQLSWQIVVGVVVAFIFVIGGIAIEVILFHTHANKDFLELQNQYFQEIKDMQKKSFESELRLQREIDSLKNSMFTEIITK